MTTSPEGGASYGAAMPNLHLVPGTGVEQEHDKDEQLFCASPLTFDIAVRVLSRTTTSIKESYQELLGIASADERHGLERRLRLFAVKSIFQDLEMLPRDTAAEELFEQHYDLAAAAQEQLDSEAREKLMDEFCDHPAVRAVSTLKNIGGSGIETPPMLRTILVLLDADLPRP